MPRVLVQRLPEMLNRQTSLLCALVYLRAASAMLNGGWLLRSRPSPCWVFSRNRLETGVTDATD
jgi:hypothetical protein